MRLTGSLLIVLATAGPASAGQAAAGADTTPLLCGQIVPPPAQLPPAGSPPVVYVLGLCFAAQGNVSLIEPATYLHYIHLQPSRPSQAAWEPYTAGSVETIKQDFARLWATGFLDDLRIETSDYHMANGVLGKVVTYHLEERQRVKDIAYTGSAALDINALHERLRTKGQELRLDSFLSAATLKNVRTAIEELLAEQGFVEARVTHTIAELPSGPKLVNVTFSIADGPKLMIRDVAFVGNRAIPDAELEARLRNNRPRTLRSILNGTGTYKEDQFTEDALAIEEYYRDRGYVEVRVGTPELRRLDTSDDGRVRWVQLRIPVDEGAQFRVGTVALEGASVVPTPALLDLLKLKPGDVYRHAHLRDWFEKAREIYGAAGYMEFTGYPDLIPSPSDALSLDVTVRVTEGPQYVVNRIKFVGNVTTRDTVIRREMQLYEGGIFNTEALKYSVRRINQLGYFKPLEGTEADLTVTKTPGREHAVDVSLALEEQNRNQMTFGAGVSQYDGFFGNLAFTTSNFMGRGESLTLSAQKGDRSANYQLAFTEPQLFDRRLSAGFNVFSTKVDFLTAASAIGYSEVREGGGVTMGRPLFRFSRVFLNYGYEIVNTAVSDDFLGDAASTRTALYEQGRYTESRLTPSFVHNTVDNPFMPRRGLRLDVSMPVAGGVLGGTTNYIRPELEAVLYLPHTRRTALGLRATGGWIRPYGNTTTLPYYLRFFLGGEYQIRGVDIRSVGPVDDGNRPLGGNKFLLFNAEYYVDLFGPVRALVFHDAGQAFEEGDRLDLERLRTSSGAEVRFMVPMLNVPFRLIYAWNVYRDTHQPARAFKFAVGTTF